MEVFLHLRMVTYVTGEAGFEPRPLQSASVCVLDSREADRRGGRGSPPHRRESPAWRPARTGTRSASRSCYLRLATQGLRGSHRATVWSQGVRVYGTLPTGWHMAHRRGDFS